MRLTVQQAADYIRLGKSTLQHMRTAGTGPRFIKLGRTILYDTRDIDLWLEENKQTSTAPPLIGRRRRRRMKPPDNVVDMSRERR